MASWWRQATNAPYSRPNRCSGKPRTSTSTASSDPDHGSSAQLSARQESLRGGDVQRLQVRPSKADASGVAHRQRDDAINATIRRIAHYPLPGKDRIPHVPLCIHTSAIRPVAHSRVIHEHLTLAQRARSDIQRELARSYTAACPRSTSRPPRRHRDRVRNDDIPELPMRAPIRIHAIDTPISAIQLVVHRAHPEAPATVAAAVIQAVVGAAGQAPLGTPAPARPFPGRRSPAPSPVPAARVPGVAIARAIRRSARRTGRRHGGRWRDESAAGAPARCPATDGLGLFAPQGRFAQHVASRHDASHGPGPFHRSPPGKGLHCATSSGVRPRRDGRCAD